MPIFMNVHFSVWSQRNDFLKQEMQYNKIHQIIQDSQFLLNDTKVHEVLAFHTIELDCFLRQILWHSLVDIHGHREMQIRMFNFLICIFFQAQKEKMFPFTIHIED